MFYRLLKSIAKIIIPIKYKVEIEGKEKMVHGGPMIISSNHCSIGDPILISLMMKREIHFLAKIELFQFNLARWFFHQINAIPVNRSSGVVIRPVRKALNLLEEGRIVGVFPEGTRIKNGKWVEPKKGVAFFAMKSGVPVFPVAVQYSKTKWGLRQKALITVGDPIDVSTLNTDYQEAANFIMERSRNLLNQQSVEANTVTKEQHKQVE
ncbi:lysophospholipid acyltransferase family protein [Salsuginibacillus kocurii]|uniref:lysophospholipid acyltransferase family protein n=1 Tax=Salsuginibacillus kocurii TaxID=427078 RepID=UPI000378FE31|nr:lysophospholipid acyltransferase family protein [Salsuginibacillus kocurii]